MLILSRRQIIGTIKTIKKMYRKGIRHEITFWLAEKSQKAVKIDLRIVCIVF